MRKWRIRCLSLTRVVKVAAGYRASGRPGSSAGGVAVVNVAKVLSLAFYLVAVIF